MKIYKVGGFVRDFIMNVESQDVDYVVVGSSVEEMKNQGFSQVGADFPVFLHPVTKDEYALARKEKKTGTGYLGFTSEFGSDVTLEEDLSRRDLTINSIALDELISVIDPFNGVSDIKNKIFRHTSDAFAEDPVRVLRIARLRARFGSDWKIAPETFDLIYKMRKAKVLDELTPERIWKEMSRALMEPYARLFFDTLLEMDVLKAIFPEIYDLKSALESRKWHPEGDAYEHTMLVLNQAVEFGYDLGVRVAVLCHDMGKGITPKSEMPSHFMHDIKGVPIAENFCNRLTVPAKIRDNAMKATRFHMQMHDLNKLKAKTFVKMFTEMGAFNNPEAVEVLHKVGVCDHRGRLGSENEAVDHLNYIFDVYHAVRSVKFDDVFPLGEKDVTKIKTGMYNARVSAAKNSSRASN